MRVVKPFFCIAVAATLAGCAAPASQQYYTLVPQAQTAVHAAAAPAQFAIRVLPISVPEQVDRPQIMLSTQGSNEMTMLNGSLWASPLADEIRSALSSDLSARLGVMDIPGGPAPESLPLWRIGVTVQRFDSVYGSRALIDATWRLDGPAQKKKPARICRAVISVPVEPGVAPMVRGHQKAVAYLAAAIASQLSKTPLEVPAGSVIMKGCT